MVHVHVSPTSMTADWKENIISKEVSEEYTKAEMLSTDSFKVIAQPKLVKFRGNN
jgi:hypothetical protein